LEQSPLRLIKRCVEYIAADEARDLPRGIRGIYVLYKYRPRIDKYDVVYVGMASAGRSGGIRGRLKRHRLKKSDLWSHCSIYEVWDNIRDDEVAELEGLFRHIYRYDSRANKLNKQRGFKKMRQVISKNFWEWKHREDS